MQTVVRLKHRPNGLPLPDQDLVASQEASPQPDQVKDGECLIENLYLSMDPAMRGWMSANTGSYLPPVKLGAVMRGGSVGRVLVSRSAKFAPGQIVNCLPDAVGWQQFGICPDAMLIPLKMRPGIPIRAWAGVLGGTGLTAYFGLLRIGKPKRGDTVLVNAAAGAVGSVVCQLAKNVIGCRVVGIAGGARKCAWLREELGVDEAVDYKGDLPAQLKRAMGRTGADVVFDNVGGTVLDACLKHLAVHARVVLCGAVSAMNSGPEPIKNVMSLIVKSASMQGFTLFDYASEYDVAFDDIASYLREGKVKYAEDVVLGLENAPRALLKLFGEDGGNFGKLVVDLHPRPSSL